MQNTNVNEGIAERLLRGQANLDHIKLEIKQVISAIKGAIDAECETFFACDPLGKKRVFESGEFRWVVSVAPAVGVRFDCGYLPQEVSIYSHDPFGTAMWSQDAHLVRRALDLLVTGVMEVNPGIARTLQKILDYAD